MNTPDITIASLLILAILLIVPLVIIHLFKLKLTFSFLFSILRMAAQLFLIGIFLKYLFLWNNPFLNVLWFIIMIIVAGLTTTSKAELKIKYFITPVLSSLIFVNLALILYFNTFVVRIENLFDARFIIVLGGMLLGNSLRSNIIGLNTFFYSIRNFKEKYLYALGNGANQIEALMPFFTTAIKSAIQPTIATMATMGIVSLPGMMTGQILGGSSPLLAIKYQIAIMIAIFVSITLSLTLSLLLSIRFTFNKAGIYRDIFK